MHLMTSMILSIIFIPLSFSTRLPESLMAPIISRFKFLLCLPLVCTERYQYMMWWLKLKCFLGMYKVEHKILLFWCCILLTYTMNSFHYYSIVNNLKILQYPNYFLFNYKQKVHHIFQNQNKHQRMNESKYINLPINSISTI